MVSSEMRELLQVADRILVMKDGRIVAELPGETTKEEVTMRGFRFATMGGAGSMIQRFLPFLTLLALAIVAFHWPPHFLTGMNLASLFRQTAVINIMGLGVTLVIVAGGIDLSVGSMMALAGLLGCMAMERGMGMGAGIAVGVAAGTALGLVNGLVITRMKINPFIVTLGTLGIFRGMALLISEGLPVHGLPKGFSFLGEGAVAGVPFVLLLVAACAAGVHLHQQSAHADGRYSFRIDDNAEAAYYVARRPCVVPRPPFMLSAGC